MKFKDNLKVRKVELDSNQLNQHYYDNFMKDEIITESFNFHDYRYKENNKQKEFNLLSSFVNNDQTSNQNFLSLYESQAYDQIVENFGSMNLYVKDRQEIENER